MALNRFIKKLSMILMIFCVMLLNVGYTFPVDSPYLLVNCSAGNNVKMYFNEDTLKYFYIDIDNDIIINTRSSSNYTYTSTYRITWPSYAEPTYVPSGSYGSVTFRVSEILEDHRFDSERVNYSYHSEIMLFAAIGGIMLCLFILLLK